MPHTESRYEFRVVGLELDSLRERLTALAPAGESRDSLELYLQLRGRFDVNLKIRDNRLELKVLLQTWNGLEQWLPAFRQAFPLPGSTLRDRLSRQHGIALALPAGDNGLEADELVRTVARNNPEIVLMSVHKRRRGFAIDGCEAEFVQLLVNGARLSSVAVESADAGAVQSLRDRLGLAGAENVSYVLALERVRGTAPLPPGAFYNAVADGGRSD